MRETTGTGLSRRGFLRAAAVSAAGFAALSGISGCAPRSDGGQTPGSQGDATDALSAADAHIEVFDTDLLIVGGGQGAIAAAWDALSEGRDVTLVEKAHMHHGGPTSWSWSCYSLLENQAGYDVAKCTNQPLRKKIADYFRTEYANGDIDNSVYQINHGQLLSQRLPDGTVTPGAYFQQYFRYELDSLTQKHAFHVFDNTMITDVFVNDGICYGAMGLHIPTGTFRVFRANATIMGVGAPVWMFGWLNTKPRSLNGSDNTGELQHALYRHGIGLAESEVPSYDFYHPYPRVAFGSSTGADAVIAMTVTDKDGNLAFPDGYYDPTAYNPMVCFQVAWGRALEAGKGGPLGGLYMGCDLDSNVAGERRSAIMAQKKFLNNDLTAAPLECVTELFDKGGEPMTDENMMTEIAGLFNIHAAGTGIQAGTGDNGYNSTQIKMNGAYAGHCAVLYLKNSFKEQDDLDWQPALDEFNRLHAIRTHDVEGGIRPNVIRENMQQITYSFYDVWRDGERCETALAELDRIIAEDLPKMICADKSLNWNREWKDAIETTALLDLSYCSAQATLFREESGRFMYYRSDKPDVDPAWDNCYTLCKLVDGKREITKETFPTL